MSEYQVETYLGDDGYECDEDDVRLFDTLRYRLRVETDDVYRNKTFNVRAADKTLARKKAIIMGQILDALEKLGEDE